MELFRLFGSILVNSDEADKSMQKTDSKAAIVASTLGKGISTAAKWGTAIVGGATAAVGGMMKMAESSAATADNIDKMSQKLGLSRTAFQELDFILSQSGTSIDSFQGGMKSLLANMDKVSEGNKTASENFKILGVEVQNADGSLKNQEQVLYETIEAFQEMEDSAEKTRLAQEMFGKSGSELMPLLNGAAGSMEEMKKQAHDLGLVMSDELIDSGVNLTDSLDQTKRAFSAIITTLGASLMPIVTQVSDYIQQSLPKIQDMIKKLEPILNNVFEKLIPPLMDLAEALFPVLMDLIIDLIPPLTQIVSALLPVIIDLVSAIAPILTPILQLLSPLIALVVQLIEPISELIQKVLPNLITMITSVITRAINPLKAAFTVLGQIITDVLSNAFNTVLNVFENIKGVFNGLIDFIKGVFTGNWKMAFQGLVEIIKNIFGGIVEVVKFPINHMISIINGFISGINKIEIPDWVPIVGGKGINISPIPLLEKGGVLEKGQTGFLEGNGAEAVVPLENNQKWIHAVANDMNTVVSNDDTNILLNEILELMKSMLVLMHQLSNMKVVTDTGALIGEIAPGIDQALGQIAKEKSRR